MGLAEELTQRGNTGAEMLTGSITSILAGSVSVNVGGNLHTGKLIAAPGYVPVPGDPVLVLRQGQWLVVLGAVTPPLPVLGVVAAVPGSTASTITVTVTGLGNVDLPFLASYSPVVSDQVSLLWRGGAHSGLVLGKVGNATPPPLPPPPPPPPPPAALSGVATFTAIDVGTWRSGWRADDNGDVIQGTAPGFPGANQGVWFYGAQPQSTLSGATVTGVEIWLGRTSGGVFAAQNCHLYRVSDNFRGGAPNFVSGPNDVGVAVGQTGWFGVPAALGQDLVNSGGSIGVSGAPYMRMFGLSKSGQAGTIRISWRR